MNLTRRQALGALLGTGVAAALGPALRPALAAPGPFTPLQRLGTGPVLAPQGTGFESAGVFNPTAVRTAKSTVLIYRAQDKAGTSRLGYAESTDGLTFVRRGTPVLKPEAAYELQGGVEDPRIVQIDGTYYMTYTGYNSIENTAQLCMAASRDLIAWERQGVLLPAYRGTWNEVWTKSGAIVPKKINGRWWMYYLGTRGTTDQMGLAVSDDLVHWADATPAPILATRPRMFDSRVAEPGPAPILTDRGILLIYNGADDYLVYSTGWVLFDINDPTKVLERSETPIFAPLKAWERIGQVPNVIFVEGLIVDTNQLTFYYGAADTRIGAATTTLRYGAK
ncbi:MAG: glycoside hydrolase family 130 protein [Candidatus Velthaea sp.]